MNWFSNLQMVDASALGVSHGEVGEHAQKIEGLMLRILQVLMAQGRAGKTRIADVVRTTAQQEGEWGADILEVWPVVVHALELHLQASIHHFPVLEAILKHDFLDNHPLFSKDSLQKYARFY